MLAHIKKSVTNYFDDFRYNGRKAVALVLGKSGIKGGAMFAGPEVASMIAGAAVSENFHRFITTGIALPVAVGYSSMIVQGDHLHRLNKLLDQYRPEISAWMKAKGKTIPPEELTQEHLLKAAKDNPALNADVRRSSHERNWSMIISGVATVISTLLVFSMKHAHMLPEGSALAEAGGLLLGGVIGLGVYYATKTPLHWIAEQAFDLEKTTVNDRVSAIQRGLEHGKSATPEQVFGVFLEAHPELSRAVRREYGRSFDRLKPEKRAEVVAAFDPELHLTALADDISSGRRRARELAFAAYGQASGVEPAKPHAFGMKLNVLERMWGACANTVQRWTHRRHGGQAKAPVEMEAALTLSSARRPEAPVAAPEEMPGTSFASRVGGPGERKGLFAERLGLAPMNYTDRAEQPPAEMARS